MSADARDPRILHPDDPGYDTASTARRSTPVRSAARATREMIRRYPALDSTYRVGVKIVGGTTVGLGVVLMPLPGPGTLIALGGLAILGTESERARRLNERALAAARRAADLARRLGARRTGASRPA